MCNQITDIPAWVVNEPWMVFSVGITQEDIMPYGSDSTNPPQTYRHFFNPMQWRTQEFWSGGVQQIQLRTENGDLGAVTP